MSEAEFVAHCVAELEALIEREGADTIAAFIGEPVLGTGGIVPPPAGYWAGDPGGAEQARHPADRRRGGHRLWPAGHDVRLRSLRHRSRHHHHRQGADLGLCAAVGLDRVGQGVEGAGAGHRRERPDRPRLDLFRASRSARRPGWRTSS